MSKIYAMLSVFAGWYTFHAIELALIRRLGRRSTCLIHLKRLLGPNCDYYHLSKKAPSHLQAKAGRDDAAKEVICQNWKENSQTLVEARLRIVKDSQDKLATLLCRRSDVSEDEGNVASTSCHSERMSHSATRSSQSTVRLAGPSSETLDVGSTPTIRTFSSFMELDNLSLPIATSFQRNTLKTAGSDIPREVSQAYSRTMPDAPKSEEHLLDDLWY